MSRLKYLIALHLLFLGATNCHSQEFSAAEIDSLLNINTPTIISKPLDFLPVYRQVLQQSKDVDNSLNTGNAYKKLGVIQMYLGRQDSATRYTQKAINAYEKGNHLSEAAYLYCERGYVMKRSNLAKAEKEMRKGLSILSKLKDKQGLAGQYNNYGVIKEIKNELDSAMYFYKLSLIYKYSLNDSLGIPYSILNIGVLAGIQNDFTKSTDSIKKAILLFAKHHNQPNEAESYFELAEIFFKQKKYAPAKAYFSETIKKAEPISYLRLLQEAHLKLAILFEKENNLKQSLEHQKLYGALKDSILNETRAKEIAQLETKFDVAKKRRTNIQTTIKNKGAQQSNADWLNCIWTARVWCILLYKKTSL